MKVITMPYGISSFTEMIQEMKIWHDYHYFAKESLKLFNRDMIL